MGLFHRREPLHEKLAREAGLGLGPDPQPEPVDPRPLTLATVGAFFELALGLSALLVEAGAVWL